MVFSFYLFKIPYSIIWNIFKLFHRLEPLVFYCGDPLDYYVFAPVAKYLDYVTYVTDKPNVKNFLSTKGIKFKAMPVFPKTVIMARHSTHKFPGKSIIKIGLRHGAYHFKKMTSANNYNQFDLYLMTSSSDVEAGSKLGITSAIAIGFPKLDPAFDGTLNDNYFEKFKTKLDLNPDKPTVLFTSTYDSSGMSAIGLWYDKLRFITDNYNVLVTTHSWIKKVYRNRIKTTPQVKLIMDYNILPYIKIADVVVGDTSSILAECCALDKPIITFETNQGKRSLSEIDNLIASISYRIKDFSELNSKLDYAITHKDELSEARANANRIFFDTLDGKAGQRAADEIKRLIKTGG